MTFLTLILLLTLAAALIAVWVRDLLSSVVAVGAVGMGLSVAFLLLHAPDVAITQLAVEIIAVIILIRATPKRDLPGSPFRGRPTGALVALIFIGLILLAAVPALGELPAFGEPNMAVSERYIERGLEETGAANLVAAVILDYRAYDTLGEATVLFVAVIGVLTILRPEGRYRVPPPGGKQ